MSITFVYRDENNKVKVKKIEYEEVEKDLIKYLKEKINLYLEGVDEFE